MKGPGLAEPREKKGFTLKHSKLTTQAKKEKTEVNGGPEKRRREPTKKGKGRERGVRRPFASERHRRIKPLKNGAEEPYRMQKEGKGQQRRGR